MRRSRVPVLLAAALTLVAVGAASCSDPPQEDRPSDRPVATTEPPPPSLADLEARVREYARAYALGDADTALAMRSAECAGVDEEAFRQDAEVASSVFPGAALVTFAATPNGDTFALVSYTFTAPELNVENEAWIVEDGEWRNNTC